MSDPVPPGQRPHPITVVFHDRPLGLVCLELARRTRSDYTFQPKLDGPIANLSDRVDLLRRELEAMQQHVEGIEGIGLHELIDDPSPWAAITAGTDLPPRPGHLPADRWQHRVELAAKAWWSYVFGGPYPWPLDDPTAPEHRQRIAVDCLRTAHVYLAGAFGSSWSGSA